MNLSELLDLLNENYLHQYNTKIVGGFSEPFYQANKCDRKAEIQFSYDYIRSALHELAHWCVAGTNRRKLDDYGYWYASDGRNQQQQEEFFKVEIKPQAIEWAFSIVVNVDFEPSLDNLNNEVDGLKDFEDELISKMKEFLNKGFPKRVEAILEIMSNYCNIEQPSEHILRKLNLKI